MPTPARCCRRTARGPRRRWWTTPSSSGGRSSATAPARPLRERPDAAAARPCADAGGGAEMGGLVDLEDDQLPRGHLVRGVQGRLPRGLGPPGCKGCTTYRPNDVTGSVLTVSETADAVPGGQPRTGAARRGGGSGTVDLHLRTARPARGARGADLQAQVAGERARALHHHQRHRDGRAAAALRDLHQLEEHGAFRLDRGADADDLGGVPARRATCPSWSRS
jgi:hypothetical protein